MIGLKRSDSRKRRHERGFTLLEIMVVVMILGLLVALVGPEVWNRFGAAQAKTTQAQIADFETALDMHRLDCGQYPSSLEGLVRSTGDCWDGPYLREDTIPQDPWGNEYSYSVGSGGKSYEICSSGGGEEQICS